MIIFTLILLLWSLVMYCRKTYPLSFRKFKAYSFSARGLVGLFYHIWLLHHLHLVHHQHSARPQRSRPHDDRGRSGLVNRQKLNLRFLIFTALYYFYIFFAQNSPVRSVE